VVPGAANSKGTIRKNPRERLEPCGKLQAMNFPIHGEVAPGFEPVRAAFQQNFTADIEVGASLCVLQRGQMVVDLWGGFRDRALSEPWTRDTLVNVYSTGKGPAAIAVAAVVASGRLDYGAPVRRYWPELKAARYGLTVAQLLSHQAGICGLRAPLTVADLYDWEGMCRRLADEEPFWEPGTAMGYHAITWGFLAGELVRRATGSTLGQVLRQRIAQPVEADFHLGVPSADLDRIAPLIGANNARHQPADPPGTPRVPGLHATALANPAIRPYRDVFTRAWQQAEIAASNGHGTGRGIARIYGALANAGVLEGTRLLPPQIIDALCTQEWGLQPDLVLGRSVRRGRGVILNTNSMFGPNAGSFGHSGTGGSVGFADPDAGLGFGYAMNQLHGEVTGVSRAERLIAAVYQCIS